MKKLLVPTDFSLYAKKALEYAKAIAKKTGAEIVLLHNYEYLIAPFGVPEAMVINYNSVREDELMAALEEQRTEIKEKDGLEVTVELTTGDIVACILDTAAKHDVSMIIMGTQGATGLKSILFGSKTAALMARTKLPVIAVPDEYNGKEPGKVLLALNNENENPQIFEPVLQLVKAFNASLEIGIFSHEKADGVHLMQHARTVGSLQHKLETMFGPNQVGTVHLWGNDFQETLQNYTKGEGIDLIVMVTQHRNFLKNLFHASATRRMAYASSIPLLSLHAANR